MSSIKYSSRESTSITNCGLVGGEGKRQKIDEDRGRKETKEVLYCQIFMAFSTRCCLTDSVKVLQNVISTAKFLEPNIQQTTTQDVHLPPNDLPTCVFKIPAQANHT